MTDDIQIRQMPAQLSMVVATHAKLEEVAARMGEAFHALMAHVSATGAAVVGPPFTMFPESPSEDMPLLVALPVAPGAVAGDEVEVHELPAGEAATLLFSGPYDAMEPSWRRLLDWVASSGRQPAGPPREVYLNDPATVAPADLLTELVVPLA